MSRPRVSLPHRLGLGHGLGDKSLRLSRVLLATALAGLMLMLVWWWRPLFLIPGADDLVMPGGDPHLRALMRTISAGESNVSRSYHVVHGGGLVDSLERHPNRCEPIRGGPNRGRCSTAAGRYQILHGTWLEVAQRYHPQAQEGPVDPTSLDFSELSQDLVVHAWLADERVWRVDLAELLRQDRLDEVLRRLSGTWTSLGYGIESHAMTQRLPRIYRDVLEAELRRTQRPVPSDEKGRTAEAARP